MNVLIRFAFVLIHSLKLVILLLNFSVRLAIIFAWEFKTKLILTILYDFHVSIVFSNLHEKFKRYRSLHGESVVSRYQKKILNMLILTILTPKYRSSETQEKQQPDRLTIRWRSLHYNSVTTRFLKID